MLQGEDINEALREQARLYMENPDDDFTLQKLYKNNMLQYNQTTTIYFATIIVTKE